MYHIIYKETKIWLPSILLCYSIIIICRTRVSNDSLNQKYFGSVDSLQVSRFKLATKTLNRDSFPTLSLR